MLDGVVRDDALDRDGAGLTIAEDALLGLLLVCVGPREADLEHVCRRDESNPRATCASDCHAAEEARFEVEDGLLALLAAIGAGDEAPAVATAEGVMGAWSALSSATPRTMVTAASVTIARIAPRPP